MIIADLTNPYYKDLSIVRTDISSLPDIFNEIQQLKKFDTVYISFNGSLVSIPESIAKLDSVKSLKITSNKSLVAIPESIGALSSLKELEISFNSSLAILPKSILLLSKDCEVSLIHNSLFPEEKAALLKALSLAGYNGPKFSFDGYRFAAKGSFPEELKRKMERGEDIAGATHQDLFRGGRV
ncbi:MAG: hypothetical protein GWP59_05960 [Chlamydiales bacterium]|nr:hypothetical protein [Chlamydiales bacterium]